MIALELLSSSLGPSFLQWSGEREDAQITGDSQHARNQRRRLGHTGTLTNDRDWAVVGNDYGYPARLPELPSGLVIGANDSQIATHVGFDSNAIRLQESTQTYRRSANPDAFKFNPREP